MARGDVSDDDGWRDPPEVDTSMTEAMSELLSNRMKNYRKTLAVSACVLVTASAILASLSTWFLLSMRADPPCIPTVPTLPLPVHHSTPSYPYSGETSLRGYYRQPTIVNGTIVMAAEGSLYRLKVGDTIATRLTSNGPFEDSSPYLSPDGVLLCFARVVGVDSEGNFVSEVHVMPLPAGVVSRLTWHGVDSVPVGWVNSSHILYRTSVFSKRGETQLVMMSVETFVTEVLSPRHATQGAWNQREDCLFFVRDHGVSLHLHGYGDRIWKYCNPTLHPTIPTVEPLQPETPFMSTNPMYKEGRVYFLSDASGSTNLWSLDGWGFGLVQHTNHTCFNILSASIDPVLPLIVYQMGADLFLYDFRENKSQLIDVSLSSDFPHLRDQWVEPMEHLSEFELSENGKQLLIVSGGRVFVVPLAKELGQRTTQLSHQNSVGVYSHAHFFSDNDVLAISNFAEKGPSSLELHVLTFPFGPQYQMTAEDLTTIVEEKVHMKTKQVAYVDTNGRLWVRKFELVESEETDVKIFPSPVRINGPFSSFPGGLAWSSDGEWLAFCSCGFNPNPRPIKRNSIVYIYYVRLNKLIQITDPEMDAAWPVWSPDGLWLFFISRNPFQDRRGVGTDLLSQVFAFSLGNEANPFEEATELTQLNDDTVPFGFDIPRSPRSWKQFQLDDIQIRYFLVPGLPLSWGRSLILDLQMGMVCPNSDPPSCFQVVFLKRCPNKQQPAENRQKSQQQMDECALGTIVFPQNPSVSSPSFQHLSDKIRSYHVSLDGSTVVTLSEGDPRGVTVSDQLGLFVAQTNGIVDLREFGLSSVPFTNGLSSPLSIWQPLSSRLWAFSVQTRTLWNQVFKEATQKSMDYFYDPNMYGLTWRTVSLKYSQLINRALSSSEVYEVVNQMFRELSAPPLSLERGKSFRGLDGLTPLKEASGPFRGMGVASARTVGKLGCLLLDSGYGATIEEIYRGSVLEGKLSVGDVIVGVNGHLFNNTLIGEELKGTVGHQVRLIVHDGGKKRKEREVVVIPISPESETHLKLSQWIEERKEIVSSSLSPTPSSSILYVHYSLLPSSLSEWEELFRGSPRGVILDMRNTLWFDQRFGSPPLLSSEIPLWFYWQSRFESQIKRAESIGLGFGHVAIVSDESTIGVAEAFVLGLQKQGIGVTIGTRTSGHGFWSVTKFTLIDGSELTVPSSAAFLDNQWVFDQKGVVPDTTVDSEILSSPLLEDKTLEKAVEILIGEMASDPVDATLPPYPSMSSELCTVTEEAPFEDGENN